MHGRRTAPPPRLPRGVDKLCTHTFRTTSHPVAKSRAAGHVALRPSSCLHPRGGSMRFGSICVALFFVSCSFRPGENYDEEDEELSSGSCGVERWAVKTGSDSSV